MATKFQNMSTDTIEILTRLSEPLSVNTIFDVGAYRGLVTDAFLQVFPDAHYYLFEPQPSFAKSLLEKFAENSRINIYDIALHNQNGTSSFNIGAFPPTSSLFDRNKHGKKYYDKEFIMTDNIHVPTRYLDSFCFENGINSINILKLDTQGSEHSILKGAENMLKNQSIDIIYTEFFVVSHYEGAPLLHAIWDLLSSMGYNLYDIFPGAYSDDGQLRYGDTIFLSNSYRKKYL